MKKILGLFVVFLVLFVMAVGLAYRDLNKEYKYLK